MTTRPVAVRVSQATRLEESSARQASRMASEIWSAILSGWPSVTDSEVKRIRFLVDKIYVLLKNCFEPSSTLARAVAAPVATIEVKTYRTWFQNHGARAAP